MKRAFIAIAAVIMMLVGCALLSRQLSKVTEQLLGEIGTIETSVRSGSSGQAVGQFEILSESWRKARPFLIALGGRVNCEPIEAAFSEIPIWLDKQNDGELLSCLSRLSAHLDELLELQSPHLINLF